MIFDENFFDNKKRTNTYVNEAYIGKTPGLIEAENQLDKFRNKYIDRYTFNMNVNSDKDLLIFDRMLEKEFGFGCCSIHIINQPVINAFTMPIDTRFDATRSNDQLILNSNGGWRFKDEFDYSAIIGVYSGIIFNSQFTTEEVMAIIMHEIGHNFQSAISKTNGVMSQTFTTIYLIISILNLGNGASLLSLIKNTNAWRSFVDRTGKQFRQENSPFVFIYDLFKQVKDIGMTGAYIISDIVSILSMGALGILSAFSKILSKVSNPASTLISILMQSYRYQNERTADNFVTMYGYGPSFVLVTEKIQTTSSTKSIMHYFNKIPVISTLLHLVELPSLILFTAMDEHPEGMARCQDQLALLKRELNKEDIDPKMRKVLLDDIKACENNMKVLTDTKKSFGDPYLARHFYNKYLASIDGDLKHLLFDNPARFDEYDEAYEKAKYQGR